jgi:hypothetical protein
MSDNGEAVYLFGGEFFCKVLLYLELAQIMIGTNGMLFSKVNGRVRGYLLLDGPV